VEAAADGYLYAVVRAACVGRRPRQAQFVVRVRLGSRRMHVVGRVPENPLSLAAAGTRLALTYQAGDTNRVRVDVIDSRSTRLLYSVTTPPREATASYGETTLDAAGDILVAGEPNPTRGPILIRRQQAWWANSRTRAVHTLNARFGASLSERHIAYVPDSEGEGERIDDLDLATGITRTVVAFSGSAQLEGYALGGNTLAWSQQRYAYQLAGQQSDACVGLFAVGSTELAAVSLSAPRLPTTVNASPGPIPPGQSCPVPV
jgi:hypothetical protein